jgi:hypothetical protein
MSISTLYLVLIHQTDHLPFSAEVDIVWNFMFIPPVLHATVLMHRDKSTFH